MYIYVLECLAATKEIASEPESLQAEQNLIKAGLC
jgi:hypothetical protein